MRKTRLSWMLATVVAVMGLAGCNRTDTKSPDVADNIRKSLDQAGLKDVSVAQDRDKGVVTLKGNVAVDADKARAESIANSMAGGQVVSDEIAVLPAGAESDARTVNSDLDKAIDKNVDAVLVQNHLQKDVRYDVKNGVVTLKGEVNSQGRRAQVEKVTSTVPNVRQVVNELEVRDQKASTTK
jgi:hyperosmotically inducible protein